MSELKIIDPLQADFSDAEKRLADYLAQFPVEQQKQALEKRLAEIEQHVQADRIKSQEELARSATKVA